jgi:hypothetical protein
MLQEKQLVCRQDNQVLLYMQRPSKRNINPSSLNSEPSEPQFFKTLGVLFFETLNQIVANAQRSQSYHLPTILQKVPWMDGGEI